MTYSLISKVDSFTLILMTPSGVQIWKRGVMMVKCNHACSICNRAIGRRAFYAPVAGVEIPHTTERIHRSCMARISLLPMQINPNILEKEEPTNAELN
jgi:hypothetical protein